MMTTQSTKRIELLNESEIEITFPLIASSVCILLNGQVDSLALIHQRWAEYRYIIVCDGAWQKVKENLSGKDAKSDAESDDRLIVLGDGDSLTDEQKPDGFVLVDDQYSTDFEKALNWVLRPSFLKSLLDKETLSIDVYWANGSELDHTLGNLAVACRFYNRLTCHFYTDSQYFRYVNQDVIVNNAKDRICSIFPFPHCEIKHTEGLLYPMVDYPMQVYSQQSLRNQINKDVAIIQLATPKNKETGNHVYGYVLFIERLAD